MAQKISTSPPRRVTIDGQTYELRTITVWNDNGQSGTIDDSKPITSKVQYKPGPTINDPFPEFRDLADRTENKATNNGWSFRPVAGPGFKKALVEGGSNSLSSQLDGDVQNQVSKDAKVPLARSQQALSKITTTKSNQELAAKNQSPDAAANGLNQAQAAQSDQENTEGTPISTPGTGEGTIGNDAGLPKKGEILKYPEDMNANQDYITFTMVESNPRALGEGPAGAFGIGPRPKTETSLGIVILPISGPIIDSNMVGWGQAELDPLSIAGAKIFRDAALKGLNTVPGNVGTAVEDIKKSAADAAAGVTYELMAQALNKPANELLSRGNGVIINPNVELLFNGVSLRPFNFTFKMSARSYTEAIIIKKIIYFFKKGMAAKQTKSGFFLKKPYTFQIEYKHKDKEHPGINLIKQCALQNFSVNYVPDGQYASHEDGNLTAYEISMQFTELDPIYFDDYDGNHPIGY